VVKCVVRSGENGRFVWVNVGPKVVENGGNELYGLRGCNYIKLRWEWLFRKWEKLPRVYL
jgi:hypothetical protein